MKDIYRYAGTSRQGHWKNLRREAEILAIEQFVINEARQIRKYNPKMGAKKMYSIIRPGKLGRDRFIELLGHAGLLLQMLRNPQRTTFSVRHMRYGNLLDGLEITGPDQVWVSDITYFSIGEDTYYIAIIMDLYTRQVLGAAAADHMRAELCLEALEQAIKRRGKKNFNQTLIHHSDRGTQYLSDKYLKMLSDWGIKVSVSFIVYENPHMERLNGTIKNEYLKPGNPRDLAQLRKALRNAVLRYNSERPHCSLEMMTPDQYEKQVNELTPEERAKMKVYVDPETSKRAKLRNQLTIFDT